MLQPKETAKGMIGGEIQSEKRETNNGISVDKGDERIRMTW